MAKSICTVCLKIFYSTLGFDRHRIGEYGKPIYKSPTNRTLIGYTKDTRRCMNTAEMLAIGMTKNQWGQWVTKNSRAIHQEEEGNEEP